ncbi:MAG: LysM peptidoglycan-binding domain-containing protein [Deltaproteobacteria bacterium]|nr:LysM peptidoglycan-binding domain-containing protein [Deltaproteobacteria bacterium]
MAQARIFGWLAGGACLPALVFALAGAALAAPGDFPEPPALRPRVAFWLRVYTEVDTRSGFFHDSEDLAIVYETVRLPSKQSRRQRGRWLDQRRKHYRNLLRGLASGRRNHLSAEQARVLSMFPENVSRATLRAASNRVRFQLGQADNFRDGLRRMGRWENYIRQTLSEHGLPTELVALPHVESSFNPNAKSHAGASGIWQFTRSTGRLFLRIDHVVDERNDPFRATHAAAELLKLNRERTGSWPLAVTAYNHGTAGMARAARQLGTTDITQVIARYKSRTFGFASKNFYASFLAALKIEQQPRRWFGRVVKDPPESSVSLKLEHYYRPKTLASALGISLNALRQANPALSRTVWAGQKFVPRHYHLRVPRSEAQARLALAGLPESERHGSQRPDLYYRVRRGDTLGGIARRYGVRPSEIALRNRLRNRHRIFVGQILELPSRAGKNIRHRHASVAKKSRARASTRIPSRYRVRRGDTLAKIAKRYGLSQRAIAAHNGLRSRHRIYAGQVLRLPQNGRADSRVAGKGRHYRVRRGDTLAKIAKRHGVSQSKLAARNGLRSRHRIYVGQVLRLPPKKSVRAQVYTVRRGDTLGGIARKLGVGTREIIAMNSLSNPNRLSPGQRLRVPRRE